MLEIFHCLQRTWSGLVRYLITHTMKLKIGLIRVSDVRSNPINIKNKTRLEIVFPIKQNIRTIFVVLLTVYLCFIL